MRRTRKARFIEFAILILLVAGGGWLVYSLGQAENSSTKSKKTAGSSSITNAPDETFNKNQYSINDPASIWAVVNKGRILPSDYVPADLTVPNVPLRLGKAAPEMKLRTAAAQSLETLTAAAKTQGYSLMLTSGYRSYNEQAALHANYVKTQGQAAADATSAWAGHSEHQTGLAADVEPVSRNCELDSCFGDTPEGKWLAANAANFGFIIRYQKGKENLTGYSYEPWHIRYVGTALATQIYRSGQTLEQFFGLAAVTSYPLKSYDLKSGA